MYYAKLQRRVIVGLVVGLVLSTLIGQSFFTEVSPVQIPEFAGGSTTIASPDAATLARPHLDWAAEQCLAEVEQPLTPIKELFAVARLNSRAFAEEAFGLDSKLTMVSDFFQGSNQHAAYLRKKFETLVISEADLIAAIEVATAQYQQATTSVEGEMLVRLRADLGDIEDCPLNVTVDMTALQSQFQQALDQASVASGVELQVGIGREVASFVLGEIATQVAIQLGTSTGIIGTGAASGWATFGASIVVGLAVDQVVSAAYDSYADPKGVLAAQINLQLDAMERSIIDGTNTHIGLLPCLRHFASQRSAIREAAIYKLLGISNGGAIWPGL